MLAIQGATNYFVVEAAAGRGFCTSGVTSLQVESSNARIFEMVQRRSQPQTSRNLKTTGTDSEAVAQRCQCAASLPVSTELTSSCSSSNFQVKSLIVLT
jgi:hypothetical protein